MKSNKHTHTHAQIIRKKQKKIRSIKTKSNRRPQRFLLHKTDAETSNQ